MHLIFFFFFLKVKPGASPTVPLHVISKVYRTLNPSVTVVNVKQITSQVGSTMLKKIGLTASARVAERRQ